MYYLCFHIISGSCFLSSPFDIFIKCKMNIALIWDEEVEAPVELTDACLPNIVQKCSHELHLAYL